jgi:hypothetical protein
MAHKNKMNGAYATMTKQIITTSLLSLTLLLPVLTYGYEVDTHEMITKTALERAEIYQNNGQYLVDLGINNPFVPNNCDGGISFNDSNNKPKTICNLMRWGAKFEDTATSCLWGTDKCRRVFNHFFDPSRALGDQALYSQIAIDIAESNPFPSGSPLITRSFTSPDWALEDNSSNLLGSPIIDSTRWYANGQDHSWRDARENFYLALTSKQEKDRNNNFGLTFQNLGHVVHHIQDMAQPQHVRNDPHNPTFNDPQNPPVHSSLFESFTNEPRYRDSWPYVASVGNVPWATAYLSTDTTPNYKTAREFWVSQGKGIAEFTRNNFFSAGTNVGDYPVPATGTSSKKTLSESCQLITPSPLAACQPNVLSVFGNLILEFFPTTVSNLRTGTIVTNPFATTSSIFNADLNEVLISGKPIYTQNGFNMWHALDYLMPEATAYSTGLINFFFRGKIDMVADTANPGQYLIKNLGNETLNGNFELYYDNPADQSRSLVTSWSSVVLGAGATKAVTITSPNPAPDFYMLVFKGDMGQETVGMSGGAVAAKKVKVIKDLTVDASAVYRWVGSGTVTSSLTGIDCHTGSTAGCSANFPNAASVTLTATPDADSTFGQWVGGQCQEGTQLQPTCTVSLSNTSSNIKADFDLTNLWVGTYSYAYPILRPITINQDGTVILEDYIVSRMNICLSTSTDVYAIIPPYKITSIAGYPIIKDGKTVTDAKAVTATWVNCSDKSTHTETVFTIGYSNDMTHPSTYGYTILSARNAGYYPININTGYISFFYPYQRIPSP